MSAPRRLVLAMTLVAALVLPHRAQADEQIGDATFSAWSEVANGRFFVTGEDELGPTGFAILDELNGPPLWSSYRRLGGADVFGVPLTRPFVLPDAHVYQLFEFALLRWQPGSPSAEIAQTLDLIWAAGRDEWLVANGVPRALPIAGDASILTRMGWLTEDAIRDAYFNATHPDAEPGLASALLRFGLPASPPERDDAGITQRFDRAALRLDFATGGIAPLPVGALLNRSGLITHTPQTPDRLVGGQLVARAPRVLVSWPNARGWRVPEPQALMRAVDPTVGTSGGPVAMPIPAAAPTATPTATPGPISAPAQAATRLTPASAPPAAGAALVIKAIVNQGRAEHVLIANEGNTAQELTGWTLRSVAGGQLVAFPAGFALEAGATVRVHSGSGASSQNKPPTDLFATSANIWNNAGDTAALVDPSGRVVHQFSYGG